MIRKSPPSKVHMAWPNCPRLLVSGHSDAGYTCTSNTSVWNWLPNSKPTCNSNNSSAAVIQYSIVELESYNNQDLSVPEGKTLEVFKLA